MTDKDKLLEQYKDKYNNYLESKSKKSKTYHIHPDIDELIRKIRFKEELDNISDALVLCVLQHAYRLNIELPEDEGEG